MRRDGHTHTSSPFTMQTIQVFLFFFGYFIMKKCNLYELSLSPGKQIWTEISAILTYEMRCSKIFGCCFFKRCKKTVRFQEPASERYGHILGDGVVEESESAVKGRNNAQWNKAYAIMLWYTAVVVTKREKQHSNNSFRNHIHSILVGLEFKSKNHQENECEHYFDADKWKCNVKQFKQK